MRKKIKTPTIVLARSVLFTEINEFAKYFEDAKAAVLKQKQEQAIQDHEQKIRKTAILTSHL